MPQSKRTGIFFTHFHGQRLRDFPEALAGILDKENIARIVNGVANKVC